MIDVVELLQNPPKQGNLFFSDTYLQGDTELGIIENRFGSRVVALPENLLQAIDKTLEFEVGGAKSLIQGQYGNWWGKTFYRRFSTEVQDYYEKPLSELSMLDFIQCLRECWISYGWGTIDVQMDAYQKGYLIVNLEYPASVMAGNSNGPLCAVESGFLSGFFSQLTQQDLKALELPSENKHQFHFVLGLPERLSQVTALIEEGHNCQTIMERLCGA